MVMPKRRAPPPKAKKPPAKRAALEDAGEAPDRLVGSLHMSWQEGEDAYTGIAATAYQEMLDRGIKLSARPNRPPSEFVDNDGFPIMPENIQDLRNQQVGELYAIHQEFYNYVVGQYADALNRLGEATHHFEFVAAKVRLVKEGKQKDKDDWKKLDRRFVMADAKAFEAKCFCNLLAKSVEAAEANLKTISRNITLLESGKKAGTRAAAINARKNIAGRFPQLDSRPTDDGEVRATRSTKPSRTRPPRMPPRKK